MAQKNIKELSVLDRLKANEDESLPLFLSKMAKFDKLFCDAMASGDEFSVKLEVRGHARRLVHCCINSNEITRPSKGKKSLETQDLEE